MPNFNHPDYKEEVNFLNFILDFLNKYHKSLQERKTRITHELSAGAGDTSDDSSDPYISMIINTQLSDTLEEKLQKIENAKDKPYFARVDFTEDGAITREKLYIGKMSVLDDKNYKPIIIDWRAPVANLYYEGRLGRAHYECPDGTIYGEIFLKRQYTIDDGKLIDMFDIDITTNDEFLQAFLGANADNRLKDIVSTIQVEQNRIIRADMWKPLIVQGVAGYRMVKKDNKFYYPYFKGIYEHDIKTNQKNLILDNNYINDITSLKGNIVTTDSILKYLDSDTKQFKPITNMMIKKVINFKDDIYLYSVNNFLYKLDLETSSIKKVFEDKFWIECYFGNKVYYSKIEGEVINRTLLNTYDLQTGEKGAIEYKIIGGPPIHEIIYIDDNFIVFTSDDGLYKFDNKNKTTKQILNQTIYSIQDMVTTDKGILFLSPEGQKLYLLEFETCELKKIVDINKTEGFINSYLYDKEEKKLYYLNMSLGGQIEEIRLK